MNIQQIEAFRCPRGSLTAERRNRGYTSIQCPVWLTRRPLAADRHRRPLPCSIQGVLESAERCWPGIGIIGGIVLFLGGSPWPVLPQVTPGRSRQVATTAFVSLLDGTDLIIIAVRRRACLQGNCASGAKPGSGMRVGVGQLYVQPIRWRAGIARFRQLRPGAPSASTTATARRRYGPQ
jgi:hypothetical protein